MRGLLVVLGLAACTGSSSNHKPPTPRPTPGDAQAGSPDVKMTPDAGSTFVRGAAVTPRDQLVAWLDKQVIDGKPRLVRLPVVLARKGSGFTLVGAKVGGGADALVIYPNDTALGIGLADRARTACKDAAACALWLEGYWRGQVDGDYTFDVIKVGAAIPADALAAASHAEVEGESGN